MGCLDWEQQAGRKKEIGSSRGSSMGRKKQGRSKTELKKWRRIRARLINPFQLQFKPAEPLSKSQRFLNIRTTREWHLVPKLINDPEVDPNATIREGMSLLYFVIRCAHVPTLKLMLKHPRVNVEKALTYAAYWGRPQLVRLILDCPRVDPNYGRESDKWTALHWAQYNSHHEVMALLLQDPRLDPNLLANYGEFSRTALHHAAIRGDLKTVKLLLADRRTDPNVLDDRQRTALHYAAGGNRTEIVECLLRNSRTKVHLKDHLGNMPFECAHASGARGARELLRAPSQKYIPTFLVPEDGGIYGIEHYRDDNFGPGLRYRKCAPGVRIK